MTDKANEEERKRLRSLDDDTWWAQLPDSKKEALQKARDKVAALAPDGAAVDPLAYLKLEARAVREADE